ncbi:MAG: hypothetical protein QXU93_08070 [Thermoproteus sp.]
MEEMEEIRYETLRRVSAYAASGAAAIYALITPLCAACPLSVCAVVLALVAAAFAVARAFGQSAAISAVMAIFSIALALHILLQN